VAAHGSAWMALTPPYPNGGALRGAIRLAVRGNAEPRLKMEGRVWEMTREVMLDPAKLRGCIKSDAGLDDRNIARELARVAAHIKGLDDERRRLIGLYAAEQIGGEEYIAANRALDKDLERLSRRKAELASTLRSPHHENFVDASTRQFCANANARFQTGGDFDARRQFLLDHVERVIYSRYKVTVVGSVPVQTASGQAKLEFRIKSEIDQSAVRRRLFGKGAALPPVSGWPVGVAVADAMVDAVPLETAL
jgi:hypothetical protein